MYSYIKDMTKYKDKENTSIHPIKLYFASIGGMIGLGNIVAVTSTLTFGGPGSIIWIWIASILGMLVKYSEIYLGIKYRVQNPDNTFEGGPMYYLKAAFNNQYLPLLVCFFLCIYGVEIFQFNVLTNTLEKTFGIQKNIAKLLLLISVIFSSMKGIKRFANICALLIPPFLITYIIIGLWIICDNYTKLPAIFSLIINSFLDFKSQKDSIIFNSFLVTAHYGLSRAVYSGDIGIGYDAIIHSEIKSEQPEKQARMAIFCLFTDTLICTISLFILFATDIWQQDITNDCYIKAALSIYLPQYYVDYFMAFLFICTGFTTIVGYLVIGQKCAKFINVKYGQKFYVFYTILTFLFFSFYNPNFALSIMSIVAGLLMSINILGLLKLRKRIKFI